MAARTTSSAALALLAFSASGCGILNQLPSPRPALAAIATLVGGDTVSTEFSPPGIFTRAQGAYLTSLLELHAAVGVADDLPAGPVGVVLVDAMGDDVKLGRSFADELAKLGRSVARLKPADLSRRSELPPTLLWIIPRAGGLESIYGDEMRYEASVRVIALESATGKVIFVKTVERRGTRDRVSDLLGLLDE